LKVLITGSSGYIGKELSRSLIEKGVSVIQCVRLITNKNKPSHNFVLIGDISSFNSWNSVLKGVDVVIHLAAIAHNYKNDVKSAKRVKLINTEATLRLGRASVKSGIKKFIYISSIGVLGNSTKDGSFNNYSKYNPKDLYAESKMEAEIGLKKSIKSSNTELIIVRPPIVYGPGSPGNFNRLLKLVDTRLPLPFQAMCEKKSMISLDNLCDFLIKLTLKKSPVGNTELIISDDSDWSTSELITIMYRKLKRRRMLFYLPKNLLYVIFYLFGKSAEIEKMSTPLKINDKSTREAINWAPIQSPESGLKSAVDYFIKNK
jgi:nucleoside-diphosphate-sugar epimerase